MHISMDQLVHLSEDKAVESWFDARNHKWLVRLLVVVFVIAAGQLSQLSLDFHLPKMPTLVNLLILVGCFYLFLARNNLKKALQPTLVYFLFFLSFLATLTRSDFSGISSWLHVFPIVFIFFRIKPLSNLFLYGWVVLLTIFDGLLTIQDGALGTEILADGTIAQMVSIVFSSVFCLIIGLMIRSREKRRFLAVWRIECNNRDRLRMKEELDHAREIQLSMLPPDLIELASLDLASCSIPASEVGGDYFDYFSLSDHELMLVVGDVSGHGVASGMVLSGVRSCLYLLEEKLPEPAALLGQLNRMLKKTTSKRMFMTFLAVHFDTREPRLRMSMAGHPPPLRYAHSEGRLEEIRFTNLPLGALLDTVYSEKVLIFESGDIFLFYTDGLVEARNTANEEYGLPRLMKRFKNAAERGDSSEKIRDLLMTDVQLFIKDAVQLDDMSLVVVRTHQKA